MKKESSVSASRSRSKSVNPISRTKKEKVKHFNTAKLDNQYGKPILPNKLTLNW